jgi:hypothetical protein
MKAVTAAIGDVYFDPSRNKCYCKECESTRRLPALPATLAAAAGAAAPLSVLQAGLRAGQCGWSGEGKVHNFVQVENCDPDRVVRTEQRVPVHTRSTDWCRLGVQVPTFASDPDLQVRAWCVK